MFDTYYLLMAGTLTLFPAHMQVAVVGAYSSPIAPPASRRRGVAPTDLRFMLGRVLRSGWTKRPRPFGACGLWGRKGSSHMRVSSSETN